MSILGPTPVFPLPPDVQPGGSRMGMNLREHFAALAMQGLLADHKDHSDECADGETCPQTTARLAVEHADALLAQLEKA